MAVSKRTRFKVFQRDGFVCVYCGRRGGNGITLEVDHRVPVCVGGTDDMGNLVTACWDCNRGKAGRDDVAGAYFASFIPEDLRPAIRDAYWHSIDAELDLDGLLDGYMDGDYREDWRVDMEECA